MAEWVVRMYVIFIVLMNNLFSTQLSETMAPVHVYVVLFVLADSTFSFTRHVYVALFVLADPSFPHVYVALFVLAYPSSSFYQACLCSFVCLS